MASLRHALPLAVAALAAFGTADAAAAITVSKAELSSGQLRVEGTGAVPNHAVTVDPGAVPGTSDSKGAFKVARSGYSSSTCAVTVTDGTSTSASTRLAGCSTSTPTPTPTPTPAPAGAPAVTLTPTSLTFAGQDTGTRSPGQTVTVKNTGTAPLFINSARTASLDFTNIDDQCSGVTVPAGGACTMSIAFNPILAGTRTASFVVTDNAPN